MCCKSFGKKHNEKQLSQNIKAVTLILQKWLTNLLLILTNQYGGGAVETMLFEALITTLVKVGFFWM